MIEGYMSDSSEDESVRELQKAFQEGRIKPGFNIPIKEPTGITRIYDKAGLKAKLQQIESINLSWIEKMDITVILKDDEIENDLDNEIFNDDFKRETQINKLAFIGSQQGIKQLKTLGIPYKRPANYFAEMLKSDDHMKKVKNAIMEKQTEIEKREQARKLRHQKKFGKKIQVQAELEKAKKRREFKKTMENRKKECKKEFEALVDGKKKIQRNKRSNRRKGK